MWTAPVVVVATALLVAFGSINTAAAVAPGLPPTGKVLLGVSGSTEPPEFTTLTRRRHHVHGMFVGWGQGLSWGKGFVGVNGYFADAQRGNYRLMVHIGVKKLGVVAQTPGSIAAGRGDATLVAWSKTFNDSGQYVYVRPMAEMNGYWNPYSAFNQNGTRRSASHSTANYRRAFRRISIIMRGGTKALLNYRLARYGLRPIQSTMSSIPPSKRVAMVWNPQSVGSPNVVGNQPPDYYPGSWFVDYVGNDLYSLKTTGAHWRGNEALYKRYSTKPFILGEWGVWGYDDPAFVRRMFDWAATHPRTKMLVWFDGSTSEIFRLRRKPGSLSAYRSKVLSSRYQCPTCGSTTP